MKKFILLFTLIAGLNVGIFAQHNAGFTIQGGYSWTMGMVGGAFQYGILEFGGGVMPAKMPGSGNEIMSYSGYFAVTNFEPNGSGYYISFGVASAGYRHEVSYGSGPWINGIVAPVGIIMLGYQSNLFYNLNLRGEVGYGFCKYSKAVFTYGITLGWTFDL